MQYFSSRQCQTNTNYQLQVSKFLVKKNKKMIYKYFLENTKQKFSKILLKKKKNSIGE